MPEIWLRYGTTDVVLDINFANLSSQISSNFTVIPEDEVKVAVGSVPLTDNMLVLSMSPSKAAAKVVVMLADAARAKGHAMTVDVPPRMAAAMRANLTSLAGGENVAINRAEYHSLQERIEKFQSAVIVSALAYDPLFGYAGAPTALVRNFLAAKMEEAFKARRDNLPVPGEESEPLKVAIASTKDIPATSIELVANSAGIASFHSGSIADAFSSAMEQLRSVSVIETDQVKVAVLSASGEAGTHATLAGALSSLWNNVHIVKDGGAAILIAECRDGVGGGALQAFVEGRLRPEQISQGSYSEGLEHLLYLQELRQKYELGLVSALPHYYAGTKLGFTTYAGMKDMLDKLPEKHGRNYKAVVLSDADITLLKRIA